MKKIIHAAAIVALILSVASCKTTEANYRAAYEIAKEKQLDGGDSTVTAGLKNELQPRMMTIQGVQLPVRTEPLVATKDGGKTTAELKVYNVVAASFRQKFNAQSYQKRLIEAGYDSFLANNRAGTFFVVAATTQSPAEASAQLDKLKGESGFHFQPTFPYVLRAAQLVR